MLEGRRGAALGLAFFLGLGVFGLWSEISSQPSQSPEYHATPKETKRQPDQRNPTEVLLNFIFHDGITTFTLLLAMFTGTLVWVAVIEITYLRRAETRSGELADIARKQMLITGRQTDIAEKQHAVGRLQFLATHRPRLRVRHVSIVDASQKYGRIGLFFDHGMEVTGGLAVVNVGGTEAKIVESCYRIYFSQERLPIDSPLDDAERTQLLIVPNKVFDVGESLGVSLRDTVVMRPATPEGATVLRRFETEDWRIYVIGQIRYQDPEGHDRFMGFCRISDGKSGFRAVDDPDYEYED